MATTASHTAMDQFLPDFSSQFLSDLQGLLEKAGRFTGATSAAIAFVEGEELVTKVSMGECAPDAGSRSPISGSFTGLCVRERDVQRCDDASKDPRVDSSACEALGIASMVMVPIIDKGEVLGVLAAFAPKPNAFSPTHVALLRTIADIVLELRKRYPADIHPAGFGNVTGRAASTAAPSVESPLVHSAPDSEPATEHVSAVLPKFASASPEQEVDDSAPATENFEPVITAPADLHATTAAIPVAFEPEEPAQSETAAHLESKPVEVLSALEKKALGPVLVKPEPKPKTEILPRIEHSVDLWKREPMVVKPVEEEPAEYARLITDEPKNENEILSTAADIGFAPAVPSTVPEQPMFGSYGYAAHNSRSRSGGFPVAKTLLALFALAAFAVGATWFFKHQGPKASPKTVQAAVPQVLPPAPVPEPVVQSQTTPNQLFAEVSRDAAAQGPGVAVVVRKTDLKLPGTVAKKTSNESTPAVKDETIVLSKTSSVPKRAAIEEVEAPKVAATDSNGLKNILGMVKTTEPEAAFRSSSITAPKLLKSIPPQFPMFARQMHIQSERVVLNGTVGKDGSVSNIKVVRGRQVFVQNAIAAVRQWKYKPATLNGEATPSTVEIVVNFVDQ